MPEPPLGQPEKTAAEYVAEARQKKAETLVIWLRADGVTAEEAEKKDAAYWKCLAERADVRPPSPATIKLTIEVLSKALGQPKSIVFAFDRPHKIGSICQIPCAQCGDGETMIIGGVLHELVPRLTDGNGMDIYPYPMLIKREATYEEYCAQAAKEAPPGVTPADDDEAGYYYEVSIG